MYVCILYLMKEGNFKKSMEIAHCLVTFFIGKGSDNIRILI